VHVNLLPLFIALSLVAPAQGQSGTQRGYVVQFAHSASAKTLETRAAQIDKAGIKEAKIVDTPTQGGKRMYRLVSRTFPSYDAARLALREARRLLKGQPFDALILKEPVGRPLIK
jgi:sporulation related protein